MLQELNHKQDISLAELISVIMSSKKAIFFGTFLFAIISVSIALYLPNQFKSKATLIVNSESNSSLSSLAGGLGGLAGVAGINLNSGSDNNPLIAKELVNSQAFILSFIEKNSMLVPLMAAINWDLASEKLIIDDGVYDVKNGVWLFNDIPNKKDRPKKENIVKEFKDIVKLSEDSKTGLITLSVEFFSPVLAQKWLLALINEINETIRQEDMIQATKSIDYLTNLLNETKNTYFQGTFLQLIEENTKTLMLSKVRNDYVFKIIDPPNLPEKKSKPLRAIICVIGTFLGGVFMVVLVLFRHFVKK